MLIRARLQAEWAREVSRLYTLGHGPLPAQSEVIGAVNELSAARDVVVCAAGSMPGDLHKLWRTRDPKGYHVEYGYSCMGYEIPAGIGVKMAEPEREVVVAIGDGTYLMLHSEIVTAVAEGIALPVGVFDNHGYQCIKDLAWASGAPQFGNELRFREAGTGRLTGGYIPVDFAKHGEAMGAIGVTAHTEQEIRNALAAARTASRPTVIHVLVSPDKRAPGYESWWDVPPAAASTQHDVRSAREQYEQDVARQRRELA